MCQKLYQPNDRLFRFFFHLVENKELESNLEMHGLAFHESHVPFLSFFTNISTCPFGISEASVRKTTYRSKMQGRWKIEFSLVNLGKVIGKRVKDQDKSNLVKNIVGILLI